MNLLETAASPWEVAAFPGVGCKGRVGAPGRFLHFPLEAAVPAQVVAGSKIPCLEDQRPPLGALSAAASTASVVMAGRPLNPTWWLPLAQAPRPSLAIPCPCRPVWDTPQFSVWPCEPQAGEQEGARAGAARRWLGFRLAAGPPEGT